MYEVEQSSVNMYCLIRRLAVKKQNSAANIENYYTTQRSPN